MLQNFMVSLQAVLPLFLMMALGVLIRRGAWLSPQELEKLNSVVFRLLFPFLVFSNIHSSDLQNAFRPRLIFFALGAIFLIFLLATYLFPKLEENKKSCGAMIQASYRSNFVLLGLPLVQNLYPNEDLGLTALAIGLVIPFYNVLAVITLESFRGGRVSGRRILRNIATNPLILGCVAGLLLMPLRLPAVLDQTIAQLAATATPMALILLGASFRRSTEPRLRRNLALCTGVRLLLVPAILLPIAALLGFRGLAFATLLGIFSTPCSVSSYVMAQQMDSDADLAGATVVYSSFLSCFSMCAWIFLFKQLAVL